MSQREKILEVKDLYVSFTTYAGEVQAVRGVSFDLHKAETIGIVGESGCGKSVTVQSLMRLIPMPPGVIKHGEVIFNGQDIIKLSDREMRNVRGSEIGMIFQDPMTSLNPTMKIGTQITEGLKKHQKMNTADAKKRAIEMLQLVGVPTPEKRINQYPHEFSGGMRQRAMIAIALACNPKLLIADEPTTALDVTIQAQIMDVMKDLKTQLDTSIILITHDLGVVADMAERIIVMYAGEVVEEGTSEEIFYTPKHPYTWGLLSSVPRLDAQNKQELVPITGTPPDLIAPPVGCPFAARCDHAMKVCLEKDPGLTQINDSETHYAACWLLHPSAPKVEAPKFGEEGGAQ